jgi:hypothetical protein
MGMPLSFFSAFWAVQDRDRPGGRKASELFDRYSLFAFVLYDPREDIALHQRLQREWEMLDGLTGEHMLFFAPIDPPEAWRVDSDASERSFTRVAQQHISTATDRLSRERGYMPLVSRDPSQMTLAFRQILGVPAGIGSCLVIASSLHQARAWLLSTDASRVGPQLERLGSLANLASRKTMEDKEVEPYITRIAGEADAIIDALTLPASLAAVLTDVCAMTAAEGIIRDPMTEARARNQLLKSAQDKTRVDLEADPETALLRLSQACAVIAATRAPQRSRPFQDQSELDAAVSFQHRRCPPSLTPNARMNARTAQLLRTGDDCLRLITDGDIGNAEDPDYRVAVAAWSQALEHEMAELLGHEVRAGLGVMLPQFHWRRQPGRSDVVIRCASHRDPISFNQARPNSPDPERALWQPPTMGPLRLGWEAWRASNSMPVPRELVDLLLQCKDFRNAAAHPGEPIPFETACEAQAAIRRAIGMIAELGIRNWAGAMSARR